MLQNEMHNQNECNLQDQMDLSASTVKMIPKRTVAGVTATSAASSRILTNSCCAMNATWPITPTV